MPLWSGKGQTGLSTLPTTQTCNNLNVGGTCPVVPSLANMLWQPPNYPMQNVINSSGRFGNIRAEYSSAILDTDYPDTNTSYLHTSPIVSGQTYVWDQITNNSATSGFNSKAPYNVVIPPSTATVNQVNFQTGQMT